ncbi:arsenite methyltransferase [Opitutus terrae]|uniref:Arsenite methyltransferase n=1 Tax=Opitutus terrae (strain DSM 11246 / JCM 15787 / PB90-1) TaxID=452637 RepID=B1ZTU1_OPITP|nr:arsenite methyltransferase [Opitutus terrae]ACB74874.1 Methyltransferase type 11 [Opitutus terrae PB90-1]
MAETILPDIEQIRNFVRERYGAIAEQADETCGCSATGCCGGTKENYGEKLGYSAEQLAAAPAGSDLGLGCGNPLAIASIRPGETVLDLGSGAGFDCFLAARQLNGTGRVIGVDMTPAMITKARANAAKSGFANVEFRLGEIEALPVADTSVDLILSNCVINLSPEKARVFREAFRVLQPGGRLAIADVVALKPLPAEMKAKLSSIGACVGGATLVDELRQLLTAAGFERIEIVPKESSRAYIAQWTDDASAADFVVSAFITAYKAQK